MSTPDLTADVARDLHLAVAALLDTQLFSNAGAISGSLLRSAWRLHTSPAGPLPGASERLAHALTALAALEAGSDPAPALAALTPPERTRVLADLERLALRWPLALSTVLDLDDPEVDHELRLALRAGLVDGPLIDHLVARQVACLIEPAAPRAERERVADHLAELLHDLTPRPSIATALEPLLHLGPTAPRSDTWWEYRLTVLGATPLTSAEAEALARALPALLRRHSLGALALLALTVHRPPAEHDRLLAAAALRATEVLNGYGELPAIIATLWPRLPAAAAPRALRILLDQVPDTMLHDALRLLAPTLTLSALVALLDTLADALAPRAGIGHSDLAAALTTTLLTAAPPAVVAALSPTRQAALLAHGERDTRLAVTRALGRAPT